MSDSKETDRVAEFTEFRQRMNERILGHDNQVVRRFFALDTQTYKDGALDLKRNVRLVGRCARRRGGAMLHHSNSDVR